MTKNELTARLRDLEARGKALQFNLSDHVLLEASYWCLLDIDDEIAAEAAMERAREYAREAKDINLKAGNVFEHATIKKDERLMKRAKRLVNGLADAIDKQATQVTKRVTQVYGV